MNDCDVELIARGVKIIRPRQRVESKPCNATRLIAPME